MCAGSAPKPFKKMTQSRFDFSPFNTSTCYNTEKMFDAVDFVTLRVTKSTA